MSDEMKVQAKGLNKKFIFIAITLIVVGLIAALVVLIPTSSKAKKVEEQLNLGAKYLSELDYEQAIVAYEAVIKIDPKCEEAYLALTDVYIATGEFDKAEEVLKKAEEMLGSDVTDAVAEKRREVEKVRKEQEKPESTPSPTPTNILTPSPTELPSPTPTMKVEPTSTPTPSPTPAPTEAPKATPTLTPSPLPTSTPVPTSTPTPKPTSTPTPTPTLTVTPVPVTPTIEDDVQSRLNEGQKYLDELQYEQALVTYMAVLDIDPKNVDAYLGIVEIYIRISEFEKALEYAEKGYIQTQDERLKEKIEMLKSGNIITSDGLRMGLVRYDNDGKILYQYDYLYNERRKLDSVVAYDADGVQFDVFHSNDLGDDWVQDVLFSDDGSINRRDRQYEGDLLLKEIGYLEDDTTVSYTTTYEYDSAGRLIRSNRDYDDIEYSVYTLYEYNELNQKIKETWFSNEELSRYILFYYNANGAKERFEEYDDSGEIYRKVVYIYEGEECIGYEEYDGSGNQTGRVRYK